MCEHLNAVPYRRAGARRRGDRRIDPVDLRILATDPYVTPDQAAEAGAELVDLATLLRTADFVSLNCALTNGA